LLGFLLRLRLLAFLLRFVIVPIAAFLLAFFVLLVIAWSLYLLAVVKTIRNIPDNPYVYGPLLIVEILATALLIYLLVVYINKVRKKYKRR